METRKITKSKSWQKEKKLMLTNFFQSSYFSHLHSLNPFMHDIVKWSNILLKSCGVNIARSLKYVWPLCNIMNEKVK